MQQIAELGPRLGVAPTCLALGIPRATYYRQSKSNREPAKRRPTPVRALSEPERQTVLEVLHEDRFVDLAPAEVYATLLDEEMYLCSERTMYRLLADAQEVRERRDQLRHPHYAAPELLATRPNEIWSWDITRLLGPVKWTYYYLYVVMDIFSRYVVGWMVTHRESAVLAKQLIATSCERQEIGPEQLTVHADRGSSMTSKSVALLMSDLGITKTHSRPHVSNDNPYSESQFKTMKYRPDFPKRFGSIEHARSFGGDFFPWYNLEHHHVGLGLYTPHDVHYGLAEEKCRKRAAVLADAYAKHPERFPRGLPQPKPVPTAVWINPPADDKEMQRLENTPTHASGHNEIVAPGAPTEAENRAIRPETENLTRKRQKLELLH